MHYFCFAVQPLPTHPKFGEMKAGYAHVMIREETEDSESRARRAVVASGMRIRELQDARLIPVERYEKIPPDWRSRLVTQPVIVEIVGYVSGPEVSTPISWEDE